MALLVGPIGKNPPDKSSLMGWTSDVGFNQPRSRFQLRVWCRYHQRFGNYKNATAPQKVLPTDVRSRFSRITSQFFQRFLFSIFNLINIWKWSSQQTKEDECRRNSCCCTCTSTLSLGKIDAIHHWECCYELTVANVEFHYDRIRELGVGDTKQK